MGTRGEGLHIEDLVARVGEVVVAGPVDPGTQIARAAGDGHVDRAAVVPVHGWSDGDAAFVVRAITVVASRACSTRVGALLAVRVRIDCGTEVEAPYLMPCAVVVLGSEVVGRGQVAEVKREILPPRDGAGIARGAQDVQVAVAVHVCTIHTSRAVKRPGYCVFVPTRPVPSRVLPPRDDVGIARGAQDIQVAITVYVSTIHASRSIKRGVHGVLGPTAPVPRRVLPPRDGVGNDRGAQDV